MLDSSAKRRGEEKRGDRMHPRGVEQLGNVEEGENM